MSFYPGCLSRSLLYNLPTMTTIVFYNIGKTYMSQFLVWRFIEKSRSFNDGNVEKCFYKISYRYHKK